MRLAATVEPCHAPVLPPGFAEFYAQHYDFLWRCALRMGVAVDDVDDLVQECFVVALRRFSSFDPEGRARPSTWLFGILRNVQRNHARKTRRWAARLELLARSVEVDEAEARAQAPDASLGRRLLDEFLLTLDEDKRAAFVLAEIEGLTGPELADALALNLNTANSRVRAARRAFGAHFEEPSARQLARAQLERAAVVRGPEAARRGGLPVILALASAKLPASVGVIGTPWIVGMLVAGVSLVTAAILVTVTPSEPIVAHSPTPTEAPAETVAIVDTRPSEPAPVDAIEPAIPVPAVTRRPRATAPKPTPLQRIANARQALLDGEPERALAWVERHQFAPELDGRRVALEVAALCRLDRQALAQTRARAWRTEHPDDPTAAELRGVCWSE